MVEHFVLCANGEGRLCVSSRAISTDADAGNIVFDIEIKSNRHSIPVLLCLTREYTNKKLQIAKDKTIDLRVVQESKANTEETLKCREASQMNDLNREKHFQTNPCKMMDIPLDKNDQENIKENKTHRRNNSDFLQVEGNLDHNGLDSGEDNTKVPESTSSDEQCEKSPEEHSASFTNCSINNGTLHEAFSESACAERSDKPAHLAGKDKRAIYRIPNENDKAFNCLSPMLPVSGTLLEGCREDKIVQVDIPDGFPISNTISKEKTSTTNQGEIPLTLPLSNNTKRGVNIEKTPFSSTLPDGGKANCQNLEEAVRNSYTYLLDVLDLLDLCDHLYEKYVLDIGTYQKLFQMCFDSKQHRNAKRSLLMYLSTRTVPKDKLIDALFGSAQYQLIPCFYPDVKI